MGLQEDIEITPNKHELCRYLSWKISIASLDTVKDPKEPDFRANYTPEALQVINQFVNQAVMYYNLTHDDKTDSTSALKTLSGWWQDDIALNKVEARIFT